MKRGLVFGAALLILAFCSFPAHAASPGASAAWDAIFAPAPVAGAQPQAQDVAARGHLPVKSGCSATVTCSNGSHVSCSGTSDCFSVTKCYASCDGLLFW